MTIAAGFFEALLVSCAAMLVYAAPAAVSAKAIQRASSAVGLGFVLALECQPEAGRVAIDRAKDYGRLTFEAAGMSPEDAGTAAATILSSLHIQPQVGPTKVSTCASMLRKYADGLPLLWG